MRHPHPEPSRAPSHRSQADFESFEASELYCRRCRRSTPVRRQLLLVLPGGNRYDYRCSVCGETVGTQTDDDGRAAQLVVPR